MKKEEGIRGKKEEERERAKWRDPLGVSLERTVHWIGGVGSENARIVSTAITELLADDPRSPIKLVITSAGGATGVALGFYDYMRTALRPELVTVGAGDCDSSGVIIFLAGTTRLLTPNTTMLLHLAGRTFEGGKRYSTAELEAIVKEDKLKDFQYASLIAEHSGGILDPETVLDMMMRNTVLTPAEAVHYGIANGIVDGA